MTGILPWLVRWTCRSGTIDFCTASASIVSMVQNIIFFTIHFFTLLVPIAQQPGQAGVLGRMSTVCVSGAPVKVAYNNFC